MLMTNYLLCAVWVTLCMGLAMYDVGPGAEQQQPDIWKSLASLIANTALFLVATGLIAWGLWAGFGSK